MRFLPIIVLAVVCSAAEPESVALPRQVLTNDGLVVLARAGLGDSLLVDLIRHKRTQFDTSAEALARLALQGLSENVLRAVVEKQEQVQLRKPRWSLSPIAPAGYTADSPIDVEPGEAILVAPPGPGRHAKSQPERWYKVWMH
jgi:hypothetical protein